MGKKEILYILITAFLFSTMEVALKIAGNDLESFKLILSVCSWWTVSFAFCLAV